MHPLFDMIIDKVPSPDADIDNPFQLQEVRLIVIAMLESLE